ncbi:MAG: ATP-binding cassette domain-containing protein, partial [Acidimicrobiia bacterium]|nr:ATP-binding cassette domain-containing protein [Acidimicrobiia bacterium]
MGSLDEVNDHADHRYSRVDRTERTLVVENLCVRYGDLVAVDSVSFAARPGEVTAVLGPNGAGKTSTIEVCEGLRRRSSGDVRVLGLDPHRDRRALANQMGVMLQEGGIYPSARPLDVVRQYCGLYSSGPGKSANPDELIELVGLSERRRTAWRRLSGGEKQRLSLALALASQPSIVFLDEPTSGVDVNGRTSIRSIIRNLADNGCTVILATHELDEAEKICDRVVIFDKGKVLVDGTLDDVRKARQAVRLRTVRPLDLNDMPENLAGWLIEETPGNYTIEDAPQGLIAALAVWLSERGIDVIELRAGMNSLELRNGEQLLLTLIIPVLLLVFFSTVDVLPTGDVREAIDFLTPGVLALAVMSSAMVSLGIATGFERGYKVLKRLGATPLGRPRWLAAK